MRPQFCTIPPDLSNFSKGKPTLAEFHGAVEALLPGVRLRDGPGSFLLRVEAGGLRRQIASDRDVEELFANNRASANGRFGRERLKVEVSEMPRQEFVKTCEAAAFSEGSTAVPTRSVSSYNSATVCSRRPSAESVDFRIREHESKQGRQSLVLGSEWKIVGYALVVKTPDGQYFSLWGKKRTPFAVGVTAKNEALPRRPDGLFICDSPWSAVRQHVPLDADCSEVSPALLRCECEGPFVETTGGKVACSALTPIEEVPFPAGDGSGHAPSGVWRRFAARDPALTGVVNKDTLGRTPTLLYWDVVGFAAAIKIEDEYLVPDVNGDLRYELGTTLFHEASNGVASGMLVAESLQAAMNRLRVLRHRADVPRDSRLVVLRCACGGPFVNYPSGTVGCSSLTPIGEVSLKYTQAVIGAAPIPAPAVPSYQPKAPTCARPTSAPAHRVRQVRRPSLPRPRRSGRQLSRRHPVACRAAEPNKDCSAASFDDG